MKAVVQRVSAAAVKADGRPAGKIGKGMLILLGVAKGDTERTAELLALKTAGLRIFSDSSGKLNLSLPEVGGGALVVSNFTLCADCASGKRPDFAQAAGYAEALRCYDRFVEALKEAGIPCETGVFGADMEVGMTGDGPVTLILDSGLLGF